MQGMALASTASSTTGCSTSWPTTYNMGKLAGIIGGMRRSRREGRRSEVDQLIYTHRMVLEMLFSPESSHIMCDDYETEER